MDLDCLGKVNLDNLELTFEIDLFDVIWLHLSLFCDPFS